MKITLIHNPGAGAGQDASGLVQLITEAGHQVRHRSTKEDWKAFLKKPADLVVAAGGDGTVRRVALAAAEHGLPFAVIPIGTANNIAKTIGLLGDAGELIESWSASPRARQPFDLGEAVAPWGAGRFVEGVGAGLIADLINREDESCRRCEAARPRDGPRAAPAVRARQGGARVRRWQIKADGQDLSGEYFAVEVLNIRFVGPNLPLAPEAFPGDGLFDVVVLGEGRPQAIARLPREAHAPGERAAAGTALHTRARHRDRRAGGRALAPRRQDSGPRKSRPPGKPKLTVKVPCRRRDFHRRTEHRARRSGLIRREVMPARNP